MSHVKLRVTLQLGSLLSLQFFLAWGGIVDVYTCGKIGTNSTVEEGENPITGEWAPNIHLKKKRNYKIKWMKSILQ